MVVAPLEMAGGAVRYVRVVRGGLVVWIEVLNGLVELVKAVLGRAFAFWTAKLSVWPLGWGGT